MVTTPATPIPYDPVQLSLKLRDVAATLRRSHRDDLASERFARRLEAHAAAMLDPELTPDYRPFVRRDGHRSG
jgi:hypothetical protein